MEQITRSTIVMALLALLLSTITTTTLAAEINVDGTVHFALTDDSIREAVKLWTSRKEEDRQIAEEFYGPIESWDTSRVTDLSRLFRNNLDFNEDISQWDVSSATSMQLMFYGASSFDHDLSNWNVSKAANLGGMFVHASGYSQVLCWPMLSEFAFVEDMFCGANGASLDPCCVDKVFVLSACCGSGCSTFCFQTTTPIPTTQSPSETPSTTPSDLPSAMPTGKPSKTPTGQPTGNPTQGPTTGHPSDVPTGNPTGRPTASPTEGPTNGPTILPTTLEPSVSPSDAPTNATVMYSEPVISITNYINLVDSDLLHSSPPHDGFYSNDDPTPTPIVVEEEGPQGPQDLTPQVSFSVNDGTSSGNSSKRSGWIGGVVGFLVGAALIVGMVATYRHQQQKKQKHLALFGKELDDEEGIEAQLDAASTHDIVSANDEDTLVDGPPDDEDLPVCPVVPNFEDVEIAIEQEMQPDGDEAVEVCFEENDLETNPEADADTIPYAPLEDEEEFIGDILSSIQLKEVGAHGRGG